MLASNLIKAGTVRIISTGMQGTTSISVTFTSAFTNVPGFIFGLKAYKGIFFNKTFIFNLFRWRHYIKSSILNI